MHLDDPAQRLGLGKADIVKETPPQKGIGQLFLVVGRDDDDGTHLRADRLAGLIDKELHPVQFLQQIVGEFDVRLVHLVDQQHHTLPGLEGLPELALADVVLHIIHTRVTQLAVAQAADRVILIKPLLRAGRGLDVPFDHPQTQRRRDLPGQLGLAGARLALDQQRPFQRDGGIDRNGQVFCRHIGLGSFEFHRLSNLMNINVAAP